MRFINLFVLWGVGFLFLSCSEKLDHPLNPESPLYVGDQLAADADGDGKVDLLNDYAEKCGIDLNCALQEAKEENRLENPILLSSVEVLSSSSSSPENATSSQILFSSSLQMSSGNLEISSSAAVVLPKVFVSIVNGTLGPDHKLNTFVELGSRVSINALQNQDLGVCFETWQAVGGTFSLETDPTTSFLVDTAFEGDTIVITGNTKECPGEFIDWRDGTMYSYTEIEGRIWLNENLKLTIPDSYCFENKVANCEEMGRLYNWADVLALGPEMLTSKAGSQKESQGLCPSGFYVPSKAELELDAKKLQLPYAGYAFVEEWAPNPTFKEKGNYGRYWTSDVGKATVDVGGIRDYCNLADGSCATGFAQNYDGVVGVGGETGYDYYAAEEKKTNLFSLRCKYKMK